MVLPKSERKTLQDPRWQRSRKALTEAILELASEQPVHKLTVRAIAQRAGVDRTTFYHHAETPEALLRHVLRGELDAILDEFQTEIYVPGGDWAEFQEAGVRLLLKHVVARQEIYRASLRNGNDNLVQRVLGAHFTEAVMVLLNEGAYPLPGIESLDEASKDFAARGVSGGLVGAITSWLLLPSPLCVETFLDNFRLFFPSWVTGIRDHVPSASSE